MNFLRRVVSFLILVAAVAVLVSICINYNWSGFAAVFKNFNFNVLVDEIVLFFDRAGSSIVLTMLGFIGLTMPSKAKD